MNESIRDYLKRRARLVMAIGIGGWLVVGMTMGSTHAKEAPPPLFIVGMLMFGGAILLLQWICCPRCSARLGQCVTMRLEFELNFLGRKSPNFCPYCGVSFDQPYREPGSPITPR